MLVTCENDLDKPLSPPRIYIVTLKIKEKTRSTDGPCIPLLTHCHCHLCLKTVIVEKVVNAFNTA